MNKRELEILNIIADKERAEVAWLAEEMGVSQVTVRKSLDALEAKGLIQREHGFAMVGSQDDINNRLAVNYEIKQNMAKAAVDLVQTGDTVLIESGSSCTLLADQIAAVKPNITIITNSAFIANYIRLRPYANVILLGGQYQCSSQVMVGPLVGKCVEGFFVDKMFIGADGFSVRTGFTGKDYARAETVKLMAEQAKQVIVLTDSSKFRESGVVPLLPTERIRCVITDSQIDPDTEKHFREMKVDVLKADAQ